MTGVIHPHLELSFSEGERPPQALNRDPAHFRELVHRLRATEPAVAAVLHAAERHLRLIVDGLVVDVNDAGLDSLRQGKRTIRKIGRASCRERGEEWGVADS